MQHSFRAAPPHAAPFSRTPLSLARGPVACTSVALFYTLSKRITGGKGLWLRPAGA